MKRNLDIVYYIFWIFYNDNLEFLKKCVKAPSIYRFRLIRRKSNFRKRRKMLLKDTRCSTLDSD